LRNYFPFIQDYILCHTNISVDENEINFFLFGHNAVFSCDNLQIDESVSLVTWTEGAWTIPILWGMNKPTYAVGIYISEATFLLYFEAVTICIYSLLKQSPKSIFLLACVITVLHNVEAWLQSQDSSYSSGHSGTGKDFLKVLLFSHLIIRLVLCSVNHHLRLIQWAAMQFMYQETQSYHTIRTSSCSHYILYVGQQEMPPNFSITL
jgi:hypothetical protein